LNVSFFVLIFQRKKR